VPDEAYYRWLRAGKPYSRAWPVDDFGDKLAAHGYVVYDYPDEAHQKADPAQDHTPYSETGWPVTSPEWWGFAKDVMPPPAGRRSLITGKVLPSLQQLGARLLLDRKAGHPGLAWLKYMNWEPERNYGGPCYQESFKPNYRRYLSSDRGHIHVSGRSDMYLPGHLTAAMRAYDPVKIIQGVDDMATPEQIDEIVERTVQGVIAANAGSAPNPVRWIDRTNQIFAAVGRIEVALGKVDDEIVAALTAVIVPAVVAEVQGALAGIDVEIDTSDLENAAERGVRRAFLDAATADTPT